MDNEKEISFGAFDSELMHQEITIPEGFEATIEGNKIILKKIESEDERIRKELIEHVKDQQSSFISAPDCRDKYEEEENNKYNSWLSWLEKQGNQKSKKVSIWKHWKDGICGNGEGKLIYLIKNGDDYSLSSSLGFECDYIELSELDNLMLEKQGEHKPNANCFLRWSKEDEKMFQSLEDIVGDYWAKAEQEKNEIKIREASDVSYFLKTIQKSPLCWIKCSDGLPNKDGTYLVVTDGTHNDVYDLARYDSIDGWHKASEIIYWMPIPQLNNKSIIEQKSAEWSEEDEHRIKDTIYFLDTAKKHYASTVELDACIDWLKAIKDRYSWKPSSELDETSYQVGIKRVLENPESYGLTKYNWKPSDKQMRALEYIINNAHNTSYSCKIAKELLEQLKKLKGE